MITRYQQTGKIITYKNPEPRKTEEMKPHKRGKWMCHSEHKKVLDDLLDELSEIECLGELSKLLRQHGK